MPSTWTLMVLLLSVLFTAAENHRQIHGELRHVADKIENNFLSLSEPVMKGSTKKLPKLDIIFSLDASSSSIKDFFEYQKNLTKALIEPFSVSPSNARVATVSCSSAYTHFNFFFDKFVNKECVLEFIPTVRYQNQGRALDACLKSIHWQAFIKSKKLRKDVKHVLFMISAGNSSTSHNISIAAKKLRKIGVEIYGLSIGNKRGYRQLQQAVSRPINEHIFFIKDIKDTGLFVEMLQGKQRPAGCKGKTYKDECNRVCQCKDGRREHCARARHEFTSMTSSERLLFIRIFKKLTTDKHLKKKFAKLVKAYRENFSKYIHTTRYFLPWHRNFLLQVENLLRRVDCRATIPYWDWTLVSGNPWRNSTNDIWSTSRGLGGDGTSNDECVRSGPFSKYHWSLDSLQGKESCLRRNFDRNSCLPSSLHIQTLLKTPTDKFKLFEYKLRQYHHIVTCAVGGTMCSVDNIRAPEYLLIASFIDHIWELWQSKTHDRWPTGFPVVSDLLPGFRTYTGEVLQLNNLPGCVRVKYAGVTSLPWRLRNWFATDKMKNNYSTEKNYQKQHLILSKRTKKLYESNEHNTIQENITRIGKYSLQKAQS